MRCHGAACALALTCALLVGCDRLLGLRDPSLEQVAQVDAAVDAPIDSTLACVPSSCPFGCDSVTNMCRPGKLWLFLSTGMTVANAFGGLDMPPNPRGGADARCLSTYNSRHTTLQCNPSTVHAVFYVNAADSIATMAARYSINVTVPVHRAADDVLVANNWNDLIDPSKPLRAPAGNAGTDIDGLIWTGANTTSTCRNWTSAANGDFGVRGYTTLTASNWLSRESARCDSLARFLCVCW